LEHIPSALLKTEYILRRVGDGGISYCPGDKGGQTIEKKRWKIFYNSILLTN
jgi:hypothetical protein